MVKVEELVLPGVAAINPYEPGKPIEEVQRELGIGEPAKLASNENPLGPSPMAVAAIRAALSDLHRYPDGGSYALRHKLAARHGVSADSIFMGSGSCEILNLLVYLFLRPGLNAVIADHSFVIYQLAVAASGGAAKTVALGPGYVFDLDAMADAIDERTRIVFLGNPNNPTGTIYRRAAWERFLARAPERVVIVADEAYFEFVRDPEYPDSMRYHDGSRLLVTLRTFSKIFGLAGLRVGYAVAREDIIRLLNNVRQPFNVTSLGQVAVMAGMDDAEHVRRTLEVNAEGMAYFEREFRRLGLEFVPSQANFILVDVGEGRAKYERLLAEGVIVRPMNGYGFPRHVRVSIGLEEENRRFIAALERVI
ncbi:MAG TPA: histidinol-phosphate transaminase [Candidatus Binataceae bacterium]|nr:histidinol-phosphate transaminase [Candidatus Binataceae bacterium]